MEQQLQQLQQQVKRMRVFTVMSTLFSCGLFLFAFHPKKEQPDIIKARGIVIVDSAGRDRILLGAPVPQSKFRVRTDSILVRKYWAKKYKNPEQFMKWYQDYYHGANGMILLNENGFDKLAVGDVLPDPNTGKRITEPTGITWNDDEGYERGGLGLGKLLKTGEYRNVIGLDDAHTGEALHMAVLEDGTKAIRIADQNGYLVLGMAEKDNFLFQNKGHFTGIRYFNNAGKLVWEQTIGQKK